MKAGKLFSLLCFIFLSSSGFSQQLCTGSLGDPVWKEDFGSGTSVVGPALSSGTTSYRFLSNPSDPCPNDGYYSLRAAVTCSWWLHVPEDHTEGDVNGYMMLVNADENQTGAFYRKEISGLCPNTTYEFAAYMLNLIRLSSGNNIKPNITFSIETPGGTVLQSINTGDVPEFSTPTWQKYAILFRTQASTPDIVLVMRNNALGGRGNDVAIDDITFRPCGPALDPQIAGTGSSDTHICEGASNSLELTTTDVSTFYTDPRYQWQRSSDKITWTDITGADASHPNYMASLANAAPGTYYYRMIVAESANFDSPFCRIASEPISIVVDPAPVIPADTPPVCVGSTLQLDLEAVGTFNWSGPNGWTSTEQKPIISNIQLNQAGTYRVVINNGLCNEIKTTQVTVNPPPVASAGMDVNICEGENTVLSASGGTAYHWWPATGLSDPDSQNPVANPLVTTTYTVQVSNANSCQDSSSVTIHVSPAITADAGPDQITIQGKSVQLHGTVDRVDDYHVIWEPADGLDDPHSLNPTATPGSDITYTFRAVSDDNCSIAEDQVFIRVYQSLQIPNTFSPNGDGINDTWNIVALNTYPNSVLTVYNRYGNVVFKSIGYPSAWDGKSNGKNLSEGTYYYTVDLKEGEKKLLSGWVMIIR